MTRIFPLLQRRAGSRESDAIYVAGYVDKPDALANAIVEKVNAHLCELFSSAEKSGHRIVNVKVRWLNILDVNTNPLGETGYICTVGYAVDRECPALQDPSKPPLSVEAYEPCAESAKTP